MKLGIIVDIVLVLVLVIMLVVGIRRGFLKMLYGFLGSVIALVVAVMAVAPITEIIVKNTSWDEALSEKIEAPILSNIPSSGSLVFYHDLNGDGVSDELACDLGNGPEKFENILIGTPYKALSKLMEPLVKSKLTDTNSSITFVSAMTGSIVTLIFTVAGFIILWIIARILIAIIFAIASKLVNKTYIFHFLDKLLGGIFGAVMGVLILFIAMTIIQFMQGLDFMTPVLDAIKESTLAKFVYNNNIIYNFISTIDLKKIFGSIKLG